MKVSELAKQLRDLAADARGEVLNGKFSYFCQLLQEYYHDVEVEVPTPASGAQIAEVLVKVGKYKLPTAEYRRVFTAQVELLAASGIPPIPLAA